MDEMQLRFLTAQALYGRDLEERSAAIRQLQQGRLSPSDVAALSVRLEVALGCQDEYVRSAAAMLLAGLAERIPLTSALAAGLLQLSCHDDPFPREAALRAIKRALECGQVQSPQDAQALRARLEEALRMEGEGFVLNLMDET